MKVWVDCTAAAHPLVLRPIIERLEARGDEVFVTAREYGQTEGILERLGIPFTSVGSHAGAGTLRKGAAVAGRSARLARFVWGRRPDLAIAHGSVDLAVVSSLFRIPSAQMQDYEFARLQRRVAFRAARRVLVPDSIPLERLAKDRRQGGEAGPLPGPQGGVLPGRLRARRGGARGARARPRAGAGRRPPAAGDLRVPRAQRPLRRDDRAAWRAPRAAQAVVVPRTERQRAEALALGSERLIVPERAIDAQSLIAFADLVVSAGGTMNREAVALGTPVFTTFTGRMGGVDEALIAAGRLQVLEDPAALELRKRETPVGRPPRARPGPAGRRRARRCRGR